MEFLSIIGKFLLTESTKAAIGSAKKTLGRDQMWLDLDRAVEEWADNLPEEVALDPRSLQFQNLNGVDLPVIENLANNMKNGVLPGKKDWVEAIIERHSTIRDLAADKLHGLQPFFQAQELEIGLHVEKLAESLYQITVQNSKVFNPAVIGKLETILKTLDVDYDDLEKNIAKIAITVSAATLNKQKKSLKYIPDVYMEIGKEKEQLRYFCDPVIFLKKLANDSAKISLSSINLEYQKLGIVPFSIPISDTLVNDLHIETIQASTEPIIKVINEQLLNCDHYDVNKLRGTVQQPSLSEYFEYMHYKLPRKDSLVRLLQEFRDNANLLVSQVLGIVERAGQGKTNLVCDLYENVIVHRKIPSVFLTALDFYDIPIKESLLQKLGFEAKDLPWEVLIEVIRRWAERRNKPFVLLIDGLNEHRNIPLFVQRLQDFFNDLKDYPFVKVLFTCRSEYYSTRFVELNNSATAVSISSMHRMDKDEKDELIEKYFKYFHIHIGSISEDAKHRLTENPLMLRVFCEAYGDVNALEAINLPYFVDIYHEPLFKKYFDKKCGLIEEKYAETDPLKLGVKTKIKAILLAIANQMIAKEKYVDVPVSVLLQCGDLKDVTAIIDEDIILRRDLDSEDIFAEERVSFTFDEFRDYIIAVVTINIFDSDNTAGLQTISSLTKPSLPVAEGVERYLFYMSRRLGKVGLLEAISSFDWFERVYQQCILKLDDELITDADIDKIFSLFKERESCASIFISLIRRSDLKFFKNLNIVTAINFLVQLNTDEYGELIKYLVRTEEQYHGGAVNVIKETKSLIKLLDECNRRPALHLFWQIFLNLTPGISRHDLKEDVKNRYTVYAKRYPERSREQLLVAQSAQSQQLIELAADLVASI